MNKRVSTSWLFKRKCFMSTVPFGKLKSPSAPRPIDVPFGIANQRSFVAPSDQNAAAGEYGIKPVAGWLGLWAFTQPVSDKKVGTGNAGVAAPAATILCSPPPTM